MLVTLVGILHRLIEKVQDSQRKVLVLIHTSCKQLQSFVGTTPILNI